MVNWREQRYLHLSDISTGYDHHSEAPDLLVLSISGKLREWRTFPGSSIRLEIGEFAEACVCHDDHKPTW